MDRQDMNLVHAHQPIDDSVRSMDALTNNRVGEFGNRPARLRKGDQTFGRRNQLGDNDRCVMMGVLTDEGANSSEIRAGLIRPENNPHDKNCFLTSS